MRILMRPQTRRTRRQPLRTSRRWHEVRDMTLRRAKRCPSVPFRRCGRSVRPSAARRRISHLKNACNGSWRTSWLFGWAVA